MSRHLIAARACLLNPNIRPAGAFERRLVRRLRDGQDPLTAFVKFSPQRTAATQRRSGERRPPSRRVARSSGSRGDPPDDPDSEPHLVVIPLSAFRAEVARVLGVAA